MVENGISKLVINNKIVNNMLGVYVYCTGIDPTTDRFLEEMKDVIEKLGFNTPPLAALLNKHYELAHGRVNSQKS